jgi:hypothetical protein
MMLSVARQWMKGASLNEKQDEHAAEQQSINHKRHHANTINKSEKIVDTHPCANR